MKKLGKFLVAGALAAIACVGLVGCGNTAKDYTGEYTGEYKYANPYAPDAPGGYGVSVTVKVKGDKIESITCEDPEGGYHNITATWQENTEKGQLGHDKTVAALPNYLKKFEGKKVDEIKKIKVAVETNKAPTVLEKDETTQGDYVLTGATQTSGRIILAVQNALTKLVEVK